MIDAILAGDAGAAVKAAQEHTDRSLSDDERDLNNQNK